MDTKWVTPQRISHLYLYHFDRRFSDLPLLCEILDVRVPKWHPIRLPDPGMNCIDTDAAD